MVATASLRPPLAELKDADLERLARVANHLLAGGSRSRSGDRSSRQRAGGGAEFLDFRDYVPGDDLRRIDWRASARSRQPQLRRQRDELSADWLLCLDRSASMAVADGVKWALALQLAAAWSYLLLHLGHRVGVLTFSAEVDDVCPPGMGRSHYGRVLRFLDRTAPRREGGGSALGVCAGLLNRRASALIVSDFLVEDGMQDGLTRLGGREVHALQVLAAGELVLPVGRLTLQDVETGRRLALATGSDRSVAEAALMRLQEALAHFCAGRGIPFTLCTTARNWQELMLEHLCKLGPGRTCRV